MSATKSRNVTIFHYPRLSPEENRFNNCMLALCRNLACRIDQPLDLLWNPFNAYVPNISKCSFCFPLIQWLRNEFLSTHTFRIKMHLRPAEILIDNTRMQIQAFGLCFFR